MDGARHGLRGVVSRGKGYFGFLCLCCRIVYPVGDLWLSEELISKCPDSRRQHLVGAEPGGGTDLGASARASTPQRWAGQETMSRKPQNCSRARELET